MRRYLLASCVFWTVAGCSEDPVRALDSGGADAGDADAGSTGVGDSGTGDTGTVGADAGGPGSGGPLVDPNATPRTKALFANLRALAPTRLLLGMEGATEEGLFMRDASGNVNWDAPDGVPIPIIYRPFHENSGGWFWWGAHRIDPAVYSVSLRAIWSWMVDYMTTTKGVHHLIWAISPNGAGGWEPLDRAQYLSFLPGLELVDVLGYDFYGEDFSGADMWGSKVTEELAMVVELAEEHGKVAAMTEGGSPGGFGDD